MDYMKQVFFYRLHLDLFRENINDLGNIVVKDGFLMSITITYFDPDDR